MDMHSVFSVFIYFLVVVLSFFIVKTWLDTLFFNETAQKRYVTLKDTIEEEAQKHRIHTEHLLLADELHNTIFKRLFQITKNLISIQKMVFSKHYN